MSKIHHVQDLTIDDDREEAVWNQQKKRTEGGGGQGGGFLVHKCAMRAPDAFVHKIPAMMKDRAEGRVNRVGSFEQVLRRLEVCVPRRMIQLCKEAHTHTQNMCVQHHENLRSDCPQSTSLSLSLSIILSSTRFQASCRA